MKTMAMFQITGEIDDFGRMDNLHKIMRREGAKLLKNWTIKIEANYAEVQGEKK